MKLKEKKAGPKKVSWKQDLAKVGYSQYFGKIADPAQIDFISFLKSSASSSKDRRKLHYDWFTTILPLLQKSSHASLKQRATELVTSWSDDRDSQEVRDLWDAMKVQDASKQHLQVLHQEVYARENAVAQDHTNTLLGQIQSGASTSSKKRATDEPAGSEHKLRKVAFLDESFSDNGSLYTGSDPSSAPPSARSSLNTNDFQYVDHLVGPGESSSKIQGKPFVMNGINVSELCMRARKEAVKNQCELNDMSELLYLNFIFDNAALTRLLPRATADRILRVSLPVPSQQQSIMLVNTGSYAAQHGFQETRQYVKELDDKGDNFVKTLLSSYLESTALWKTPTSHPRYQPLPLNEDSFTQGSVRRIIVALLQDLDIVDHWSRDPLPTPRGFEEVYQPDYFAECEGFPICVVEIKKPDAKDDPLEGDARKLPNMMKLCHDRLLGAGVESPIVGVLVEGTRCSISTMDLRGEAFYIHKTVGVFELPVNNLQIGLLAAAIAPLMFAKSILENATQMITNLDRVRAKNRKADWQRPSYYVKGNRVPVPKVMVENIANEDTA
ncbi:hypothetical protein BGX31_000937, partial [Mortierella sp. GBA43]